MATWDLGNFSSYELGKVADAFRDAIAEHPLAPAGPVLRAACRSHLLFDQRFRECWSDPTFPPRYEWLRARLEEAGGHQLAELVAADVVAAIDAMVDELEARDA